MAFRAERGRLKNAMRPGEEIIASDLLDSWYERPNLQRPPVLVVTNMCAYLILSGRDREVSRIDFDALVGVGRKESGRVFGCQELQLILDSGEVVTLVYNHRDRHGRTADLVTERYFGHIVRDTTTEFPQSS
jgi:hypothetical protein